MQEKSNGAQCMNSSNPTKLWILLGIVFVYLSQQYSEATSADRKDCYTPPKAYLLQAVRNGDIESLQAFKTNGTDFRVTFPCLQGHTLLHEAANRGKNKAIIWLLANGVNVESKRLFGETPLHGAAAHGHMKTVKLLIDKGANVSTKDNFGRSVLHYVTGSKVVDYIVGLGANVHQKDNLGQTPLHRGTIMGYKTVVKSLIRHGADVNATTNSGETALYLAIAHRHLNVTRFLINAKTDLNAVAYNRSTALQLAEAANNHMIVQLLLDNGAKVTSPPSERLRGG